MWRNVGKVCFEHRPSSAHGRRTFSSRPPDKCNNTGNADANVKKTTIGTLKHLYETGMPISMMTASDYPSGLMVDKAGIDSCLVGDSLAMVSLGYDSTNPITVDEMLHHCRAVARGCKRAFLIGDLPYGSYEVSPKKALETAIRFLKEGNVEAVKLEGGAEMAETIHCLVNVGVTVVAHVGFTPQRHSSLGGYRMQAKTAILAKKLLADALAVQEAGASLVVLEAIPEQIADNVTRLLKIPTIGCGAGIHCSGQVLVQNDALGVFDRFIPRFVKNYGNLRQIIDEALRKYNADVKCRSFPGPEHTYPISADELAKFLDEIKDDRQSIDQEAHNIEKQTDILN